MHITFSNDLMVVIDDFLTPLMFQELWSFIQTENFEFVHSSSWTTAFNLSDGTPLWGNVALSHQRLETTTERIYPTQTALDFFIKNMRSHATDLTSWIGQEGVDWDFFFIRPYLYPKGSGLSWHTDGKYGISAAYVYYCHPIWDLNWGAELLVSGQSCEDFSYPEWISPKGEKKITGFHLNNAALNAYVQDGIGHYIIPKPNRLVIFKKNILHAIKKVDDAAGNHVRASITGFFMKDEKVREIKYAEATN